MRGSLVAPSALWGTLIRNQCGQARRAWAQWSPSCTPGGTANTAEPDVLEVLVQRVAAREALLHRDELRPRVAHDRRGRTARRRGGRARRCRRRSCSRDAASARRRSAPGARAARGRRPASRGAPSAPVAAKSGSSNSRAARQRCALALVAADDRLLLARARRGPRSRSSSGCGGRRGSCRPPSTPAPSPRPATQTCSSSAAVSSALMLAVPSLKPIGCAGVVCAVEVDDVRPKPSCDQRTAHDAEARSARGCAPRAPRPAGRRSRPGRRGRRRCAPGRGRRPANARQLAQRGRAAVGEAEAVAASASNSDGPKPKVSVSCAGEQVDRLAGVVRRRLGDARRRRRPGRRRRPASSARPPRSSRPAGRRSSSRVVGDDVEGHQVQPVLGGRA